MFAKVKLIKLSTINLNLSWAEAPLKMKKILGSRKNFVLDVCTYSEDIFDLVKKNIITIDEVTNFFNFLNNNDSTSLTLYAYVYLRRKIWDKCENIFCNFINGKHIFPAPLSHVISSSLDITKLFSSNEYFYINDDVFEYKYFEHFAITFNIHEIKINRTTGSMHASALYNFENFKIISLIIL